MKPGRLIFVIFFQLFLHAAFSQVSEEQLNAIIHNYAQNLKKKGIDTVCIYQQYCNGCLLNSQTEESLCSQNILFFPTYIFWINKGNTYVTKKDICFDYSVITIPNDSFWTFFFSNQEKIEKEELRKPQYLQKVNGKNIVQSLDVEHTIFYRIRFQVGRKVIIKNINSFYFTELLGPSEEKNISYDYNAQSLLKKLQMILQRAINGESEKKKLVKIAR